MRPSDAAEDLRKSFVAGRQRWMNRDSSVVRRQHIRAASVAARDVDSSAENSDDPLRRQRPDVLHARLACPRTAASFQ